MSWHIDNGAPDYSNTGSTCFLNVRAYYSDAITKDDIESMSIIAANGWRWTATQQRAVFGTNQGKAYMSAGFYYGENPHAFPLAGNWTVELKLKNGKTSSGSGTIHEPGSASAATHAYVYTKEDYTPSSDVQQFVPMIGRFPAGGYTVQYSPNYGGSITSTNMSSTRRAFLLAEPLAYNMTCWLYDANKTYLGYTTSEYSTIDHTQTGLISVGGELSIVPASTHSSAGTVDLSRVRYLRFVYTDGAQFAPASYARVDYQSISALVPVN